MTQTMTVTITQSGQITLPKAFREMIGVKPGERVTVEANRDRIQVRRKANKEEFFSQLRVSKKSQKIAEYDGDKSVSQIMEEYYESPAGKKEMEEKYGRLA